MTVEAFEKMPASQSCRQIPFDKAEIRPGIVNDTFFLIVSGEAPCLNMEIKLQPLVYVRQPDYWGIEVVGCLPGGICLPALQPYTVFIPLTGIAGKKGIEVIGSSKSEKIALNGKYWRDS